MSLCPRAWLALLAGVLAVLLAGCQVSVGGDVTVSEDGSGRLQLTIGLDEELAASLAEDGIDPFAGLEELPDGWQVERDGDRTVTVSADFASPEGLTQRVQQLQGGLDGEDPMVLDHLDLTVEDDGAARLEGWAGFRPPSSTGLRGAGVAFDGDDLQALLEERGEEVLRVDLRVAMPGRVVDSNADEVDGSLATWRLPVTELAQVRVASEPPSLLQQWLPVAVGALVGLVLGVLVVRLVRSRRR